MPVWGNWYTRQLQTLVQKCMSVRVRLQVLLSKLNKENKYVSQNEKKQAWEMSYDELYADWASRYSFGARGDLTVSEAQEVHKKWMRLGKEASAGF